MKKNYERMEAYKVEFNANEQVAAAACDLFLASGKYDMTSPAGTCDYTEDSGSTKLTNSPSDDKCGYGSATNTLQYA